MLPQLECASASHPASTPDADRLRRSYRGWLSSKTDAQKHTVTTHACLCLSIIVASPVGTSKHPVSTRLANTMLLLVCCYVWLKDTVQHFLQCSCDLAKKHHTQSNIEKPTGTDSPSTNQKVQTTQHSRPAAATPTLATAAMDIRVLPSQLHFVYSSTNSANSSSQPRLAL